MIVTKSVILGLSRSIWPIVPKCASTSVKVAILESYGMEWRGKNPHRRPLPYDWRLDRFADLYPGFWVWSIVRDPRARLLSAWADRSVRGTKFANLGITYDTPWPAFVRAICAAADDDIEGHACPQVALLSRGGRLLPDYVAHVETLATDYPVIQERTDLGDLRHERTSKHRPTAEMYDAELSSLVYNKYEADYDTFGYSRCG